MKKINENGELHREKRPIVATIGTFDGVHRGHQAILRRTVEQAKQINGASLLITFSPHPLEIVRPDRAPQLLTTLAERQRMITQNNVDLLYILPFNQEIADTPPREFIQKFLVSRFHIHEICIGYDHGFGRDRSGGIELLQELGQTSGFSVSIVPPVLLDNREISSTKIRHALTEGDLKTANSMLGHPYGLAGEVIYGQQNGRHFGFPTANLRVVDARKLIPKSGVYFVRVRIDKKEHNGVMNIGYRPTLAGQEQSLEVHLLDYSADLYGQHLEVELLERVRGEIKFATIEMLRQQIYHDVAAARQYFAGSAGKNDRMKGGE